MKILIRQIANKIENGFEVNLKYSYILCEKSIYHLDKKSRKHHCLQKEQDFEGNEGNSNYSLKSNTLRASFMTLQNISITRSSIDFDGLG